jgi:hypothetical protein
MAVNVLYSGPQDPARVERLERNFLEYLPGVPLYVERIVEGNPVRTILKQDKDVEINYAFVIIYIEQSVHVQVIAEGFKPEIDEDPTLDKLLPLLLKTE